jgi:molecular chaperone GrpE
MTAKNPAGASEHGDEDEPGKSVPPEPEAIVDRDAEEDYFPKEAAPEDGEPPRRGDHATFDLDETGAELTDEDEALLDQASRDLVAEMRSDMLRAQAELVNFRSRVERDRAANRDAVIAEVIRSMLPALDDLARAEAHGDLIEGNPLTIVAQKLRGAFEKYGLRRVGEKGEPFNPAFHEAVVQIPSPDVKVITIADVIEPGYLLGERLVRPAKVAVSVPAQ